MQACIAFDIYKSIYNLSFERINNVIYQVSSLGEPPHLGEIDK